MRILKYRTIAEIYPFLSLEAMVQLKNGDIVYTNIAVNNRGEKITDCEDSHWTYRKPLTELDGDEEELYFGITAEEEQEICCELIRFWNDNPVFNNNRDWKPYVYVK